MTATVARTDTVSAECHGCGIKLGPLAKRGYCQNCTRRRRCVACGVVYTEPVSAGLCLPCAMLPIAKLDSLSTCARNAHGVRVELEARVEEYRERVERLEPTGDRYLYPADDQDREQAARCLRQQIASKRPRGE